MTWNSCSDSEESVLGAVTCYPGKYLRQKIFASDWQERSVISYWIWCWNPLISVGMNQTSWLKKTWIKETQHHEEQGDIIETRNETSIQTREEALDMIKAQQHSTNIIHNLSNLASAGLNETGLFVELWLKLVIMIGYIQLLITVLLGYGSCWPRVVYRRH